MPAPTVKLLCGSITMKLPVCRLRLYSSQMSGLKSCIVMRPISFKRRVSAG